MHVYLICINSSLSQKVNVSNSNTHHTPTTFVWCVIRYGCMNENQKDTCTKEMTLLAQIFSMSPSSTMNIVIGDNKIFNEKETLHWSTKSQSIRYLYSSKNHEANGYN